MHRLKVLSGHLCPPGAREPRRDLRRTECGSAAGRSDPDDVVVVHGRRTAIGRAKRGAFKVKLGVLESNKQKPHEVWLNSRTASLTPDPV